MKKPVKKIKKKDARVIREVELQSFTDKMANAMASALGSDAVHRGSFSDLGEPRLFIPSGIPDLDRVLDRKKRGWPVGRIVEIFGDSATAKTAVGYALIAQMQKLVKASEDLEGTAVLFPSEGNFDSWLADQYKINLSELVIADNETVEGISDSFRKGMQLAAGNKIFIGMIDSIAGMTTKAELDQEETRLDRTNQMRAQLISKFMRKVGAAIPRSNAILFCINQIRDKTDVLFGEKTEPPGGKALKFYASIRLKLELIKKLKATVAGKTKVVGLHIRITAIKNRLADPYETAEIKLHFKRGLLPIKSTKSKSKKS